ncbi:hypothetical protein [Halorussus litoreus]|uniref:hypothetical protein n=1 Tax=Halorussus litoreus TaxID=1710536 RepID=UPI000E276B00|nr:hypothetical protein [Halorussus litoreus]
MALLEAILVFVVGLLAGTVVRWVAGLAAVVALVLAVLGFTTLDVGLVDYVLDQYYLGNELLFVSGFLFGIDAERTKEVVVERRE